MKTLSTLILMLLAVSISGCAIDRSINATPAAIRNAPPAAALPQAMEFDAAPAMILEEGADYLAVIETSKGNIALDLFEDEAPITVNNFVFLANEGFYDGVLFHRVIDEFMIQGGDRNGIAAGRPGTGGPGYQWPDEASALELVFDRPGLLAMANAGPNTNGSQFFITHVPTTWLNGAHAIFGEVANTESMDVVNAIAQNDQIITVTISTQ
ncbi:MAG: peptidylprolyl isomerase [Phototrophicaceae bacterium]